MEKMGNANLATYFLKYEFSAQGLFTQIKKKFMFCLFLRESQRERERERETEGQREGDTESEAGSRLRAIGTEPDARLQLTDREIVT